ncbi:MAG: SdpI family protein [Rhodothermales bacterium]|nr:SdpI family protein [Rhodothermales bacterium]
MRPESAILLVTFGFSGLLMIALGVPLVRRRVKPNAFYGFRFRDTLADERVWYDVNEAGGRDLVRLGVLQFVGGLPLAFVPEAWLAPSVLILAAVVVAYALAMAVRSYRMAKRLRAAYDARDRGNRPA